MDPWDRARFAKMDERENESGRHQRAIFAAAQVLAKSVVRLYERVPVEEPWLPGWARSVSVYRLSALRDDERGLREARSLAPESLKVWMDRLSFPQGTKAYQLLGRVRRGWAVLAKAVAELEAQVRREDAMRRLGSNRFGSRPML